MQKVLILPSWYPNSKNNVVGIFFKEQAEFLNNNGFDIKVLYGNIGYVKSSLYYKLKKRIGKVNVEFIEFRLQQNPKAISFPIVLQRNWSEKKKYETQCEYYKNAVEKLFLDGWKPDLIHAQSTVDGGLMANYLSEVYKIPYMITEHQTFNIYKYSKFKRLKLKDALMNSNKLAAVSFFQRQSLLISGIYREIDVIWNFVDEDFFKPKKVVESKYFVITTITYPSKIKNVELFFRAISHFKNSLGNTQLIKVKVIGNNSFNDINNANVDYYKSLSKKYDVYEICEFVPYLDRVGIKNLLQQTDVFISTSISETFGVAVREAMLCGANVVCTKSGGVEDTINSKTGLLVEIGDYESISDKLQKLFNKEIEFDLNFNRNFVINQSGRNAFLNKMREFYKIEE